MTESVGARSVRSVRGGLGADTFSETALEMAVIAKKTDVAKLLPGHDGAAERREGGRREERRRRRRGVRREWME